VSRASVYISVKCVVDRYTTAVLLTSVLASRSQATHTMLIQVNQNRGISSKSRR